MTKLALVRKHLRAGKIVRSHTRELNKVTAGDVKKFKVFVKDGDSVKKVNFGDPNMEIKRDNPERRKSFRARHKCSEAKDKTSPKYWSCKMWDKKPVSKIVSHSRKKSVNDPCWASYKKVGMKKKGDRLVPNCVKI